MRKNETLGGSFMKLEIRPAMRQDIPEIIMLRSELLTFARGKPVSVEDIAAFKHFYEDIWDGINPMYFVCVSDSSIAGQVGVSIFPGLPSAKNPAGICGYIYDVSVKPAKRRKGIARALIYRALKYSKAKGVGYLSLHATSLGEPLYRSLGFAESMHVFLELWREGIENIDFSLMHT